MTQRLAFLGAVCVILVSSSAAHPKFASRMNLSCVNCHVNPTGGGMRNTFGATSYGQEELPIPTWQENYSLEGFSTQINDFISVGADFRTLYFYQETGPTTSRNSFFQMQSDVYLSMRLAKKTSIYLNRGIGSRFEAFGLAGILPMNGYLKVGWFVPNFGLRVDDHNIFTRDRTLFANGGGQDAGIEVVISPGIFTFTASLTNGATLDRDADQFKALLGRGEAKIGVLGINFRVGGSYYNSANGGGVLTLMSVHSVASIGGNLTLLGEFVKKRDYSNLTGSKTLSSIYYVEADYVLTQGLDLKAGYEFYDPDTYYKTGTQSRIVIGFELFPISGVELRPQYVIRKEEPTDIRNNQFLMMFHFYL